MLRRLLGHTPVPESVPREYAYTVHWLNEARGWSQARRTEVRRAVARVISESDFTDEPYKRKYVLTQIDSSPHAGASLAALLKVLEALENESSEEGTHG
jgi:hypothetical protein